PFRFSFGHALSQRRSSTNVYVKVTLSDATTGFGEGVPRVYVTGETVDDAVAGLCKRYAPALVGCRLDEPESVPAVLDHVARAVSSDGTGPPGAAWCALELAVLDAAGRHLGVPVRRWLGPLRASTLHYDAVVPFSGRRALDPVALEAKMLGLRRAKVKVGVDLAEGLSRRHRLRCVGEARALIEAGACDAFNIRVSKCGGLLSSMQIATLASAAGLTTIVGAQVGESGILSAAGRHLAACIAPRYLEGSAGRLLLKAAITQESPLPGRAGRAQAGS